MFFSLVLLVGLCGTALPMIDALTRAPFIPTPASQNVLPTPSLSTSLTPSDPNIHIELRALPKQPSTTLSTHYTTTPSAHLLAREETTISAEIIGYTSTQGVCVYPLLRP
jgi:hypothetical protein